MTAQNVADAYELVTVGDLGDEVGSFVRALKRDNVSPNSIATYGTALRHLAEFLAAHGYPTDVRRIEARYIDEWIIDLLERQKPATAHNRFRGAQRFFTGTPRPTNRSTRRCAGCGRLGCLSTRASSS